MTKLEATVALTKLIAPKNREPVKIRESLLTYSQEDWQEIIDIANSDLLAPLLYKSLQEKKLFTLIEDETLKEYLKEFYHLNETRNIAILKQLEEICSILETIDVKPTLLKGSAALSEGHYKSIGERVMLDIDFYVGDEKIYECIDLLKQHGYKEIESDNELSLNWHHYRKMYRNDVATSIEIHRLLLKEKSLQYFLKTTEHELYLQSSKFTNASVLKPTYELYYSFLHTEISHFYYEHKHLSIRHMQHFNVIWHKYEADIQFEYLHDLAQSSGIGQIWNDYLTVQNYFYDLGTPAEQSDYLHAVQKKINNKNRKLLQIQTLYKMLEGSIGYSNLRKHYNFKSKFLMPFLVPYHLFKLLYSYSINQEKRKKIFKIASTFIK